MRDAEQRSHGREFGEDCRAACRKLPPAGTVHNSKRVLLDIPPHWNRIGVPVLLVKGGRSDRITPAIVADAKSRCPQVHLVEIPGADHHVTLDNPGGFVDAVNAWLRHE